MKSSERHRLKENELSSAISDATARLAEQKQTASLISGAVLVVVLIAGGYWAWHTRSETRAQVLLAEGMAVVQARVEPPKPDAAGKVAQAPGTYPTINARAEAGATKFMQVANQYPSTKAGIAARYYAASALMMLGRPAESATRYQEVLDKAGAKSFYGRMAQLGVVEAQIHAKQFDQAIAKAQTLANAADDENMPKDATLMELGRAYAAAGKKAEAKQTFEKVLADFPESAFGEEARVLISSVT
jgi:hypothetical protein